MILPYLGGAAGSRAIALILALVELALSLVLYRLALPWQGGLLQDRESQILEAATQRGE